MADISNTACPKCATPTLRYLDGISRTSVPDYYRCDRCSFVFLCPKGQSGPMQGRGSRGCALKAPRQRRSLNRE